MTSGARDAVRPPRGPALEWSGLLPLDKPTGMTSHDVVAQARRALGTRAIGHLGTLDPDASGLLVLLVGAATRCATLWQDGEKTYEASLRLGVVTHSQDLSGEVLATHPVTVGEDELRAASRAFVGDLLQVPPMVSALKHQGQRLHALARRGETVEREPRAIHVASWEWRGVALPEAHFTVRCSGGTYVRTLAHDLGAALGCGASLSALRRTASGAFDVARACPLETLRTLPREEVLARYGIALDEALTVRPTVTLDDAGARAIGQGQPATVAAGAAPLGAGPRSVVLRDAEGHALALGELRAAVDGRAQAWPNVVFPWAVREGGAA